MKDNTSYEYVRKLEMRINNYIERIEELEKEHDSDVDCIISLDKENRYLKRRIKDLLSCVE